MLYAQNTKVRLMKGPYEQSASGFTSEVCDTIGYDYCQILFLAGTMDGATSVLQVKECDTTGGSYTTFSNEHGVFGLGESGQKNVDSTTSADPSSSNNLIYGFEIDLKDRKRFLKIAGTADDVNDQAIVAILSRGRDIQPDSLSLRGFAGLIRA